MDLVRQAILAGSAARLARRMDLHNGYRTLGPHATLAQLHPCTARIAADDDGLLPEWVVFHELIATARKYLAKASFCLVVGMMWQPPSTCHVGVSRRHIYSVLQQRPYVCTVRSCDDASRDHECTGLQESISMGCLAIASWTLR